MQLTASKVPLPTPNPGKGGGEPFDIDRIVEQVEARMFRRMDKMVNDRVELAKLRMEEKIMKKIDIITGEIREEVRKSQHKGLLSQQTFKDQQQRKQIGSHDELSSSFTSAIWQLRSNLRSKSSSVGRKLATESRRCFIGWSGLTCL